MVSAASPRKQPQKSIRTDPSPRPIGGLDDILQLENPDESLWYCWVTKNGGGIVSGVPYYRALGFQVVKFKRGGVAPVGMKEDLREGEPIENFDCVLMACTKARKAEIDLSGQRHADAIERRIIDRGRGPRDLMRNIPGLLGRHSGEQTIFVRNETQAEQGRLTPLEPQDSEEDIFS